MLAELRKLYEEVQRRTAQSGLRCLGGGGCCKFDLAGHRLYLTPAELALLIERPPALCQTERESGAMLPRFWGKHVSADGTDMLPQTTRKHGTNPPLRCPYQARGKCTAYDRRPLGCRVYFCQPGAAGWYANLYEEYHQRVGALHGVFEAPYRYVELTAGLAGCHVLTRVPGEALAKPGPRGGTWGSPNMPFREDA